MGRHNRSFATKHQQDACEFLTFLLDLLDTQAPSPSGTKPAQVFSAQGLTVTVPYPSSCVRLAIEDRLECGMTRKVRPLSTTPGFVLMECIGCLCDKLYSELHFMKCDSSHYFVTE